MPKQNPKECGWFYHAPARKQVDKERVDYPAPSNIPGIGYDDPSLQDQEEVRELMFKETDSDYIRLAKMGGRKDLLAFNPDRYRSKKVNGGGYARNDWFYLEDNRLEDEEKKEEEKKEWQFLLPEYMVHKNYQPSFNDPKTPPTRTAAPFHTEGSSVMKDEGRSATDKTVKIPEVRRPGYGVRNEKPPAAMGKNPPRERPVKPQESENISGQKKYGKQPFTMPSEREDPTNMGKLLSGEYEREWYDKLAQTQPLPGRKDLNSEEMNRQGGANREKAYSGQGRIDAQKQKKLEEEKELFKLARFKNVPSKIDSHQRPEILAAVK